MTDKLRECPICGCEAIYEISREDSIVDKIPQLFCNGCKMTFEVENDSPFLDDEKTFQYLKEKLHTTWNTRKPMDRIVDELEAKKKKFSMPKHCKSMGVCPSDKTCSECIVENLVEQLIDIVKGVQND